MQQEALDRAIGNQSTANWGAIFAGFTAKGIPETDIRPRENVFTYHAWRALGRQVRRGEHGVKVTTWVPAQGKEETDSDTGEKKEGRGFRVCKYATVFHVSQTDPIQPGFRPHRSSKRERYARQDMARSQQAWNQTMHADSGPDPVDLAFEDRCAEAAGINLFAAPE
jgi:hypothetical protein